MVSPRRRPILALEELLERRVSRDHRIRQRCLPRRRQPRTIALRHAVGKIRERLPKRCILGALVLRARHHLRHAVQHRRRQRESIAHADANVGDVLVEVTRHVVQPRDIVFVLFHRLRIGQRVQLQQIGEEPAVAVERNAPLLVPRQRHAACDHELEQARSSLAACALSFPRLIACRRRKNASSAPSRRACAACVTLGKRSS